MGNMQKTCQVASLFATGGVPASFAPAGCTANLQGIASTLYNVWQAHGTVRPCCSFHRQGLLMAVYGVPGLWCLGCLGGSWWNVWWDIVVGYPGSPVVMAADIAAAHPSAFRNI